MTNLQKRILAGIIYFPLLLLASFDSRFFAIYVAVLLFLSWHEYLSFTAVPGDTKAWTSHFGICLVGSLPAVLMALGYDATLGFAFILLFLQVGVVRELIRTSQWKNSIQKYSDLVVGWIYITGLFSLLLYVQLRGGPQALLFLFLVVGAADTGAYFGGKFWGKTEFFSKISPKKTQEGFYCGLATATLVAVVFCVIVKRYDFTAPSLLLSLVLGSGVALASVFGDLFESSLKRHFGVKDSGQIIPGHGGIMDRFDGVIFGVVPLFFYVVLFGGFK
jgi:phosphatidate cytidylyltransferase